MEPVWKIRETDIAAALAGKISPDDARRVAGLLCRDPADYAPVAVIDDDITNPDDGHPEEPAMLAPCRPAGDKKPCMSELPAYLFGMPWLRQELRSGLGPAGANAFYAAMHDMGGIAKEAAYLTAVLRETYGTGNLPAMADAAVFAQPAYAPFRDALVPVLEQYIYT